MTLSLGSLTASATAMLLVKATLLLLAALGASALLQRASAGVRHLVWVAIVAALLVLPVLATWGPVRLAILPAEAPRASTAAASLVSPQTMTTQPNVTTLPLSPQSERQASNPAVPMSPWRIAGAVWASIALVVAAWLAVGFFAVKRVVRRARPLDDRLWTHPLYDIADRLGIDTTPRVMRSEDVKMPFACGIVRPTIILPAESDTWDEERRRAVLMHELAHIRRRDLLGHTLGRVACAVYWFHPLIWMAAKRLRIESERACDDLALTCGLRATNYAEHLLDIVSNVGRTRTPAVAIPMAHRREFEGRMLAILDPDVRRRVGRRQSVLVLAALAVIVVVVGGAVPVSRSAPPLADRNMAPDADTGDTAPWQVVRHSEKTAIESKSTVTNRGQSPQGSQGSQSSQGSQGSPQPNPAPVERAEVKDAELLRLVAQDTARNERPALLVTVLRTDSSARLRRVAAWGLSNYADRSEVSTALANALRRDPNAEVREMAAWALADQGSGRGDAVDALADAVRRDANSEVRETAAWALGQLDAERAVDVLGEAATSGSGDLRKVALWALGNASPSNAPRAALNALSDPDKEIRLLAAWVLYQSEDGNAVPALEQALNREQDRSLRMAYIRALGAIGEKSSSALARLIDSRDPEVREVVIEALAGGRAGGPWPWPWPRPRPFP